LHLALIDLEAQRAESFGNVRGGHRAEELIVLASLAREAQGNAIHLRGLLLCSVELRCGSLCQRGTNALERLHVALRGLDGQLARQKKIARVARLDRDDVASMAELLNVFLQDDLHADSLCSCFQISFASAGPKPSRSTSLTDSEETMRLPNAPLTVRG